MVRTSEPPGANFLHPHSEIMFTVGELQCFSESNNRELQHNSARFDKLQEILAVEDLTPKNREMNFSKSKEEDEPEHRPAVKSCE